MKFILTSLIAWLLLPVVLSAQFIEVYRQTNGIMFPTNFYVFEDDKAVFLEPLSDTETVKLVDLQDGTILSKIKSGRGPGEVSRQPAKVLSRYHENQLWLWDSGLRRGMILDQNLNYVKDIDVNESIEFALPLTADRVATWGIMTRRNLFTIKELDSHAIGGDIAAYQYNEFDEYRAVIDNPLARQGPTVLHNNALYQGYWYSSLIIKIDEEGTVQYMTGKEHGIDFPEYTTSAGVFEAPNHSDFPQSTKSMAVNDDYLFVLHSGRKFDEGRIRTVILQLTGKMDELNTKYDHSDRLLVYDNATGDFIKEIQLPEQAYRIQATNDYFYIYNYEDEPVIIKYEIDF